VISQRLFKVGAPKPIKNPQKKKMEPSKKKSWSPPKKRGQKIGKGLNRTAEG
jgi:hypothetical protein